MEEVLAMASANANAKIWREADIRIFLVWNHRKVCLRTGWPSPIWKFRAMDSQILVGDKIDTTSEETSTRVVEVESNKVESINVRPDIKPVRPSVSVQKSAEKKIEDKEDEKVLEKLYKKTLKELQT